MAILTDVWERKILNHIFVGGSSHRIAPQNKYLALSTQAFTESDTPSQALAKEPGTSGTTYNNNGYARLAMTDFEWDNTNKVTKNTLALTFSQCTTSGWGSIQYWALFNDPLPSNGTSSSTINADEDQKPVMVGSFSSSTTVSVGDQFRISSGDFQLEIPQTSTAKLTELYSTYATFGNHSDSHTRRGIPNMFSTLGLNYSTNAWQYTALGFRQALASDTSTPTTTGGTQDNIYIGISTSAYDANEAQGSYQEVGYNSGNTTFTNNGYSTRPQISFNAASTDSNGLTTITNNGDISFAGATANWGSVGYWALYRGSASNTPIATTNSTSGITANRPFMSGSFSTAKTVNSGDQFRIPSGDFKISLN